MELKRMGLVIGSILLGGGIGMLSPIKEKYPAVILIIMGILIQIISTRDEMNPIETPKKP